MWMAGRRQVSAAGATEAGLSAGTPSRMVGRVHEYVVFFRYEEEEKGVEEEQLQLSHELLDQLLIYGYRSLSEKKIKKLKNRSLVGQEKERVSLTVPCEETNCSTVTLGLL